MSLYLDSFLQQAEAKAFSAQHRKTLNFNLAKYRDKVVEGKRQFADLEKAKRIAKNIKWYALENLPRLLMEFEQNFQAAGGKIIWAEDAAQAEEAVLKILREQEAKLVVKSKSMLSEEIELNHILEQAGIEVLETDLGEYIVQLRGEAPYHIVTPAMHLNREEIAQLFHEKFGTPDNASPEFIMAFVREQMRQRFAQAQVGITGANFLIANTGGVLITENEGNARLTAALPRTHIVLAGIEKILPTLQHLDIFLPLLASHGTGQDLTVYNSIYHGPAQTNEHDGPRQMYVILIDNGRSALLADPKLRESLYCIRCGACLNACPVYKQIGGHSYEAPYGGPIGSVIMPHLEDFESYGHLSQASSLCGACTESCPVKINLHEMLLHNRRLEQQLGLRPRNEQIQWRIWRRLMLGRMWMNVPAFAKRWATDWLFGQAWGERRRFPEIQGTSFNQLWRKGQV